MRINTPESPLTLTCVSFVKIHASFPKFVQYSPIEILPKKASHSVRAKKSGAKVDEINPKGKVRVSGISYENKRGYLCIESWSQLPQHLTNEFFLNHGSRKYHSSKNEFLFPRKKE